MKQRSLFSLYCIKILLIKVNTKLNTFWNTIHINSIGISYWKEFKKRRLWAHNPKVTGSSPVPATKHKTIKNNGLAFLNRFFLCLI